MKINSTTKKQKLFQQAIEKASEFEKIKNIGSLNEKLIHKTLKYYLSDDVDTHEISVGYFIADIFVEGKIFEIQTASFKKMLKKLEFFLKNDEIKQITVVYPVLSKKYINWVDTESGEIKCRRMSTKKGKPTDIFLELYGIKKILKEEKIKFKIIVMQAEEYRLLDGYGEHKKKRATKFQKKPTHIIEEIDIVSYRDLMKLLPTDFDETFTVKTFTVKDFTKHCKISTKVARICLNVLCELGLAKRVGKEKRAYIYSMCKHKQI